MVNEYLTTRYISLHTLRQGNVQAHVPDVFIAAISPRDMDLLLYALWG